ncbi:tetraacyldisaccharide 4'-kinase [Candidatus Sororendozoicomonas aggregata]|uniref:tetraacyldisaccharide 4'-kinase n=1 Tax=Candidatus Sororendozoicomonas aggregata TaxID=3073239 RepID=UPI002ED55D9D
MFTFLKTRLHTAVMNAWYGEGNWTRYLSPFSAIFASLARWRKDHYQTKRCWKPPVPVIVVGNITVGGTGKTPVVTTLARYLAQQGYQPGVVSRGFGSRGADYPVDVTALSSPGVVGDEPVMLATQCDCPVVVDPDRVRGAKHLCEVHQCTVIITDDGLQHYNLRRHIELVVVDGARMLGNGLCLPGGPLREPAERLKSVDFVLINGDPVADPGVHYTSFHLVPAPLEPVSGRVKQMNTRPQSCKVHAVAGIGNPQRFFKMLSALGFDVIPHPFPDHHWFTESDITFSDSLPVIMTAKDAVKCQGFADTNHWYLPVITDIPSRELERIARRVQQVSMISDGQETV